MGLLTGERLLTIIQSDNPLFSPDMMGEHRILWNRHEFDDKQRIKN